MHAIFSEMRIEEKNVYRALSERAERRLLVKQWKLIRTANGAGTFQKREKDS